MTYVLETSVDWLSSMAGRERWCGPGGSVLLSYEVDFRADRAARIWVRAADGGDHLLDDVRLEIVEPERIVFSGCAEVNGECLTDPPGSLTFRRADLP